MKSTLVLHEKSPKEFIASVDWSKATGKYIVRDPLNRDYPLYLVQKDFLKLCEKVISDDIFLEVLGFPGERPEDIKSRFGLENSKSTPSYYRGDLRAVSSKMFTIMSGWKVKESMIEFERNFEHFLPIYYRDVMNWLGSSTSPSLFREVQTLGHKYNKLRQTRGINQLISILKIESIAVLQYLAGTPLKSTQDLGQRVHLINGLPARISHPLRMLIRSGSLPHIRGVLTLLHSYKGMRGIYKKPDMSSILAERFEREPDIKYEHVMEDLYSPLGMKPLIVDFIRPNWDEIKSTTKQFWKDFNPNRIKPVLLRDSESLSMPLKAGPNHSNSIFGSSLDALAIMTNKSMFRMFDRYREECEYLATKLGTFRPSRELSIFTKLQKVAEETFNTFALSEKEMFNLCHQIPKFRFHKKFFPFKDKAPDLTPLHLLQSSIIPELYLGKLAIKLEAAGKIRVFAISDFWTQQIMLPLHISLFEVLKGHTSDATFDQEGKVKSFMEKGHTYVASFDLKSATDLIPIQLYEFVLGEWTTPAHAKAWSDILTKRDYFYKDSPYRYNRGQPMGTLSSWASLAMVHHFLIFLSAKRVGISNFRDYLVLGDDVVIANKAVAESYQAVCSDYGITIGLAKSFISEIGMFQFASQNILKDQNISPISLKEVLSCSSHSFYFGPDYNLAKKYEFVTRLVRRGYIDSSSWSSCIRAVCTASETRDFHRSLTKGIIPENRIPLMAGLLMKKIISTNNLDCYDLIASLRGDIKLFSKTVNGDPKFARAFMTRWILDIKSRYQKASQNLGQYLALEPMNTTLDRALPGVRSLLEPSLLESNTKAMKAFMKINKEFNGLMKSIKASLTKEFLENFYTHYEETAFPISVQDIIDLHTLCDQMEALAVRRLVVAKSLQSFNVKIPYMTQVHLSLLNGLQSRSFEGLEWLDI